MIHSDAVGISNIVGVGTADNFSGWCQEQHVLARMRMINTCPHAVQRPVAAAAAATRVPSHQLVTMDTEERAPSPRLVTSSALTTSPLPPPLAIAAQHLFLAPCGTHTGSTA